MAYSMVRRYRRSMVLRILLSFAALAGALAVPSADARSRQREQDNAFRETKQGNFLPLPMIESRIVPRMRGADYLGPELNGGVYRLKFLKGSQVIWVDVDARTGRVLGTSGR